MFPPFAICREIFANAGRMGCRARLKSFAVQDVGRLAPCVKEQGETPFDCGPNPGEYWGFAGLNCSWPFHPKPFHHHVIFYILDKPPDVRQHKLPVKRQLCFEWRPWLTRKPFPTIAKVGSLIRT